MKKITTKSIAVIAVLSLLFSLAACGKNKKSSLSVPTTLGVSVAQLSAEPISEDAVRMALSSAGLNDWDGDYANLTAEQKKIVEDYFALTENKGVEVRADGVYYTGNTAPENENQSTLEGETTGAAGGTTKPAAAITKPGVNSSGGVEITSLKLNKSVLSLGVGGNEKLTATIMPSNAKDKSVSWKSDNEKVASVDNSGTIIAKSDGKATITCKANSGNNVTAACAVTVTIAPTGALLSYKYNEDEGFFYIENDPWQRNFGFNRLYDLGAPITQLFYDTVRVKFNYGGLDWMIQMWKGQYGYAFIGSEIGIYTKPVNQLVEHYDCASDENSLNMQMSLYQNEKWLFDRTYAKYWWITGFVPGGLKRYADTSELTMLAMITFKDTTMTNAFVNAFNRCGFTNGGYNGFSTPDIFKVEGNSVYFNWKQAGIESRVSITFDANGGTGGTGPTMMDYGAPLAAPAVSRDGYTFLGWSSGLLQSIVQIPSKVPSADKTYKAQWTINSYPITFDANGGTGGTGPAMMDYGAPLAAPVVSRDGYTFLGWSSGLLQSTVQIPSTVPAQSSGVNKTYKALWRSNS